MSGHIVGGIYETAEDDGLEPVSQQSLYLANGPLELVVFISDEFLGAASKGQQLAADTFGRSLSIRAGAEVEGGDVIHIVLIENRPAPDFIDVLVHGFIYGGAVSQRGNRGSWA